MSQKDLTVESRSNTGKGVARQLRRSGKLPAVIYGHGETPVHLSVDAKQFNDLIAHSGTHVLLNLKGAANESAVIKNIDRHPVRGVPATIDFQRVSANERITTKVHIILENDPLDVKTGDGLLVQSLHEIEISAPSAEVPDHITVDISHLVVDGPAIHISEITVPAGVTVLTPGDEAIAAVNKPKKVDLDAPIDEADAAIEAEGLAKAEDAAASNAVVAEATEETPAAEAEPEVSPEAAALETKGD